MRRVVTAALIASTAAVMLCSCQKELTAGPANFGESPSTLCIAAKRNETVVAGEVLQAPKAHSMKVVDVQMTSENNVHLRSAYIVPIGSEGAIGSARYPVDLQLLPSWADRKRAEGGVVNAGAAVSIAMVLQRGDEVSVGDAGRASVTYSVDGHEYKRQGAIVFKLASPCR